MEAYLDNAATTRALPEVADIVKKVMTEDYGNPSSLHTKGFDAEQYIRQAADDIARTLKVDPSALINAIRTEQIRGRFYQRPMD